MLPLQQLLQLRLSVLQVPLILYIISQQGIETGLLLRSKVLSGHIWQESTAGTKGTSETPSHCSWSGCETSSNEKSEVLAI
ncbi:hypothetical protein CRYUN_Cryun16bG0072500 [Craigia yunnanensis]